MKKILISSIFFFSILCCKAQIIPVEEHLDYLENETELPDGAYIKDINNLLNKYVGTWIGNYDEKTYEFAITKVIYQSEIRPLTIDELRLRYKITDSNGNIILDTTNLPDESYLVIKGSYLSNTSNTYILYYQGEHSDCGQFGDIFISVSNNNLNEMKASLELGHDLMLQSDCPNGPAEQILPTDQFTLIKQ